MLGGNAQRALFVASTLGYPCASQRGGLTIETNRVGQAPPPSWRKELHAVDARGFLATVVLADPTHR